MQTDDPKYLKRKIRSGSIDVHPTEKALIVNYELEALILGENGDKMLGDKKEHQKIIRLNSLNARTDCAALAKEVVDKCSLIHQAKLNEVEHLIRYLKNRKENSNNGKNFVGSTGVLGISKWLSAVDKNSDKDSPRSLFTGAVISDKPSINNVDLYVENLYEDSYEKVVGSAMILKLAQNPNNLEELANNESALSALSRVLREDWKKNMDLATNIVYIFNCFSAYTQFHPMIVQYKIGSLCMELIDYELRRYGTLKEALDKNKSPGRSSSPLTVKKRQSMIPVGKRRSESANRLSSSSDDYRKSLPSTPNQTKSLIDSLNDMDNKKEDELINKQDQLLRVSVNLLLNLAENTKIEEKMRKRNISKMLMMMLDRTLLDLVVLCLKFLTKLSVFKENKDDMCEINLVENLTKVVNCNREDVQTACYRLLYNLSFDARLREQMVRFGFLPRFVSALNSDCLKKTALGILYHLSMDDKVKSMFTYTDCISILFDMLLEKNNSELVVALGINLALNKRNAELMAEENRLSKLLTKAFKTQDPLLMKMLHNMVMADGVKHLMVEFVGDIAKASTTCDSDDFVIECLGILGNLTMPELDYCQVLQQFGLVQWLQERLQPAQAEDDVLLAAVVLLGTAACDEDCALLLCKAGIINALIELLKAKQEDDEMVLQIVYVFYQTARHDDSREYLIRETEAPAYLIDLMQDKNKEIAKVCDSCLDIISECDAEWKRRIMLDKFRFHNANWLEMVESQGVDDTGFDDLPPYLTAADLMQHTMLYQPEKNILDGLSDADDDDDDLNKPRSRFSREIDIEMIDDFNGTGSVSSD